MSVLHLIVFTITILQEEDSIPMCTLRNFPHFPEHCIEWARAQFSDWFEDMPSEFNSLLRDPQAFFAQLGTFPKTIDCNNCHHDDHHYSIAMCVAEKEGGASVQLEQLRRVAELLERVNGASVQMAARMAVERFHEQVSFDIIISFMMYHHCCISCSESTTIR